MAENYSAVVTELGASLIEDAYNNSTIVNITQMAIGDSNGAYVEPNPAFSSLVNELGREDIHESSTVGHLIHVYVYVTSKFAGDTVREFGLYDDANNLVVYAAYPESLVPDAASGEYIQLEIECIVDLESAEVVNIVVNPIYPHATELEAGIAKIVSETDVDNDEEDSKFLTIKKLLKRAATTVKAGVARFSTSAEAINGTDTTTMLNPSAGLALLKSRISSAPDGTRTDYSASESALSQVNTKAVNAQETADEKYDKTGGRITGVVEQYIDGIGTRMASSSTTKAGYLQAGNYDASQPQKMAISGISGVQLSELNILMKSATTPKVNGRDILVEMPFNQETNPYDIQNGIAFNYSSKGFAPFTGSFISFGVSDYQLKIGGGYEAGKPLWFSSVNGDEEGDPQNAWVQLYDTLNPPSLEDIGAEHIGKAVTCRTIGYAEAGIGGTPSPLIFGELQDPFDITTLESSGIHITVNYSGYYMLNSTLRWDVHDGDKSIDVSIYVNGTIVETLTFRTEGLIGAMALPFQYYAHFSASDIIKIGILVNLESGSTSEGHISSNGSLSLTYTRPSDTAARIANGLEKLEQMALKTSEKKKK